MSNITKGLAVIAVVLAIGVGLVIWKTKVGGHGNESLNRITKEDMALILKDANPMQLKQLAASPEAKGKIAENIRQLLAVASQARKEGLAEDPNVRHELESTRSIVPADYDGDGKADVAVFRPSNGTWYLLRSNQGFTGYQFGILTDLPVPADYDGDGKTDIAVYRDGTWYLQRSTQGFTGVGFGAATDKPIPSAFVQ